MSKQHDQNTQCAFCGKAKNEVAILVAGLECEKEEEQQKVIKINQKDLKSAFQKKYCMI